jgi:hypothetical protein
MAKEKPATPPVPAPGEPPNSRLVLCPECDTEVNLEEVDECPKCGLDVEKVMTKFRYENALKKLQERASTPPSKGKKKDKNDWNPFD